MRQFRTLVWFEMKKVLKQKSTWITFGILFACQLFLSFSGLLGSTYIDGQFLETHADAIAIDRAYGEAISGRVLDLDFMNELRTASEYYQKNAPVTYYRTESYQKKYRPYEGPMSIINSFCSSSIYRIESLTPERLLEARDELLEDAWANYRLTLEEKRYWIKQEKKLPSVYTYQYADAYDNLTGMPGCYMCCMVVSFFIAVCMSNVFTKEHARKTDQFILCSQYGRKEIYFAKLVAGSILSLCACLILLGTVVSCSFAIYGASGFTALVQTVCTAWTSQSFTMGELFFVLVGLLLLITLLTGLIAMIVSELCRSNIASIAILIALLFGSRMIPVNKLPRTLSLLGKCLPLNLLEIYSGFFDPRLIHIFGLKLTVWQVAPILYLFLGVLLVFIGKKVYCNYQVDGR